MRAKRFTTAFLWKSLLWWAWQCAIKYVQFSSGTASLIFHSSVFVLLFLPVVVAGFYLLARFTRHNGWTLAWLAVASLIFYGWGEQSFILLIGGSAVFNFLVGRALDRQNAAGEERQASATLTLGIVVNLCVLGYFKYAGFFVENVTALLGMSPVTVSIALPLAISFFTLQQIAYLVDVRRGLVHESSFLRYLLFVTFFPQLIAGPIVHHTEMLPQFRAMGQKFQADDFADGVSLFILGLAKKIVFADQLATIADPMFLAADQGGAPSFFIAWIGLVAFSLQIYFDFSAYSDMAIGIGKMFGIRLPDNFRSPYKAVNIVDFWRRWHMTLSRFLRDYLYIPLGGSRLGPWRWYRNLMLTMLIGGLWHGAAWGFVVWGGLHGVYLVLNHLWQRFDLGPVVFRGGVGKALAVGLTFLCVTVSWIFFRAETFAGARAIVNGITGNNGVFLPHQFIAHFDVLSLFADAAMPGGDATHVLPLLSDLVLVGVAMAVVFLSPTIHQMAYRTRLIVIVLCGGLILQGLLYGVQTEFIYFRF